MTRTRSLTRSAVAAAVTVAGISLAQPAVGADDVLGADRSRSSTAPVTAATAGAAPDEAAVEHYLEFVIHDLDTRWSAWFAENGFSEARVGYHLVGSGDQPFVSQCVLPGGQQRVVIAADHPNVYYCPDDDVVDANGVTYEGSLLLPVLTMAQMWNGTILPGNQSTHAGDFAAAIVVAHEFGHHATDELLAQWRAQGYAVTAPTGKWSELLADCFAGNWVADVHSRGLLEPGDFEEGVAAMAAIGDGPGSVDPHGSAEERVRAVQDGFTGTPQSCWTTYWRQSTTS